MKPRRESAYKPFPEEPHQHAGRPREEFIRVHEQRVAPQPIGERCNPLCPFFVCGKHAMFVVNRPFKGRMIRVAQCRLTGGDCINGDCQYASCKLNALLPDGRCAKALEKKRSVISDEELFRQMRKFEEYDISEIRR
ncbi:MAG: hypothetical protein ACP5KA_01635 [Desulfurococcaceae archaeon]